MFADGPEVLVNTIKDEPKKKEENSLKDDKTPKCCQEDACSSAFNENEEFFDAAVFYCEKDYAEANELIEILKSKISLENEESPKIDLFDIISPSGDISSQISCLFNQTSCVILYLTTNFVNDDVLTHLSHEILINSVQHRTKNLQLVFLKTTDDDVPFGLRSMCHIKWNVNRDLAIKKLKKILGNARKHRKHKENLSVHRKPKGPEFIRTPSMLFNPLTPSPDVHQPTPCYVFNAEVTCNYNINATNVQIATNSRMYGVDLSPECDKSSEFKNEASESKPVAKPDLVSSDPIVYEDKINVTHNISAPVCICNSLVTSTKENSGFN